MTKRVRFDGSFSSAIRDEDVEMLSTLIRSNCPSQDKLNKFVHMACRLCSTPSVLATLLDVKGSILYADEVGNTPLHCLAVNERANSIVPYIFSLPDVKSIVHMPRKSGSTPLAIACGQPTCTLFLRTLITYGLGTDEPDKLLRIASLNSCPEVVALLMPHCIGTINKLSPNNVSTALMCAAENPLHGYEIVKLLLANGADILITDSHGFTAAHRAVAYGADRFRLLCKDLPLQLLHTIQLPADARDPIGINMVLRERNLLIKPGCLHTMNVKNTAASKWASIHLHPNGIMDCIVSCTDPKVWFWYIQEFGTSRNVIFHDVAKKGNLIGLEAFMKARANPFHRDNTGKIPYDYATDKAFRLALYAYMNQPYTNGAFVMRWYGPYCIARCYAFLLVLQRGQLPRLNRDLVSLIIGYVRKLEYI